MQRMLGDLQEMQQMNRGSEDDLAEIRRMVYSTKDNVDHHIQVVGSLWENLNTIHEEQTQFDQNQKSKSLKNLKQTR